MNKKPVLKKINIKHPIVQFFTVGALLFVLNYLVKVSRVEDQHILMTDDMIEEGIKSYEGTWGEYPDSTMLRSILEDEIEKEVLFRKGLELGLDRNNDAIKEELALATKQYLMAEADLADPGNKVLRSYWEERKQNFKTPEHFDFSQYYYGENEDQAREAKAKVEQGILVHGIENKNLSVDYVDVSLLDVAQVFGPEFAKEFQGIKDSRPKVIRSFWGWHVIVLNDARPGKLLDFERSREMVLTAWRENEQKKHFDSVLRELKNEVKVEFAEDSLKYLNRMK